VAASHTRTSRSLDPVTTRLPPGTRTKAASVTVPWCPVSATPPLPVAASQVRAVSRRDQGSCYGVPVDSPVVEQFPASGARLYTETRGAGPLLLFVVGGNGDPAAFSGVAGRLARDFTVVTYARRGFARSPVDGPVDDANRIATDVEDAVALIARHGGGPARVFGSSSGAIVALDLVTRHPDLVSTAVVHEPPILELLDDPDAWAARFAGIFATYKTAGLWPAMAQFGQAVGLAGPAAPPAGADVAPEIAAILARTQDNMTFTLATSPPSSAGCSWRCYPPSAVWCLLATGPGRPSGPRPAARSARHPGRCAGRREARSCGRRSRRRTGRTRSRSS
jgi:pimeloyl-ACP methyl ester carboxylesterase